MCSQRCRTREEDGVAVAVVLRRSEVAGAVRERRCGEDGGARFLLLARGCAEKMKVAQGADSWWLQLLFSSGGGAPRRPARLAAAAVWRVVMVAEIRVRVLGDEGDDVARSEWSIG